MFFEFSGTLARWPEFAWGAVTTLWLAVVAMMIGLAIGAAGAACRMGRNPVGKILAGAYVEILRNTPFLVQIYIVYFGLPAIGLRLTPTLAAIISLSLYCGAYATEILRAGFEAVGRGQWEAARAIGLTPLQSWRLVALTQALAAVYPALVSQFILLMLASSLASAISVTDLTAAANDVQGNTFRPFEAFLLVAAAYLLLTALVRVGLGLLERRVCAYRFVRS